MNLSRHLAILALSGLSMPMIAANVTQVNRYATVANEPLLSQVKPLKAIQQMHFPREVKTIGEAVDYWLHYSGFQMVKTSKQPENLQSVLNQPLPQVDRSFGPLSIETGLLVLVGKDEFILEEVSFRREVNFKQKGAQV